MAASTRYFDGATRLQAIEQSQMRSRISGLTSDMAIDQRLTDVNVHSRLAMAARPVIERLTQSLDGLAAGGLLTDRHAVVVHRYFGQTSMRNATDRIGAVVGASFSEELTGTNAIATARELRRPILVQSEEHFLDMLKGYTCYGAPIIDPGTSRLEGVIDLMVEPGTPPGLMLGVLNQAVDEITARLVDDWDPELKVSIAAFHRLSRHSADGVSLIGPDLVVHNSRSLDILAGEDVESLREMARRADRDGSALVTLSSGRQVTLRASPGSRGGAVLLRLRDSDQRTVPIPRSGLEGDRGAVDKFDRALLRQAATGHHVVVVGERGTGRSRAARLVAGPESDLVITGGDDESALLETVRNLTSAEPGSRRDVVVEDLDRLPPAVLRELAVVVGELGKTRLVMTTTPPAGINEVDGRPDLVHLVSLCPSWVELPPLRERLDELPRLVEQVLRERTPSEGRARRSTPRFTQAALEALRAQCWPGNIAELVAVVDDVLCRRGAGDVVVADLPDRYQRRPGQSTSLSPLEIAERDLIVRTLAHHRGNKVHTARHLGLSRTTLYARLKYYKID